MVRKGFESFLLEHNGKNFIEVHNVNSKSSNASLVYCKWPKILRRRYGVMHPLRWFRSLAVRLFQLGFNLFPNKNILPSRIKLYRGSQWFCITYDLAKYIVQYLNENPWYYLAFGDSLISDEWFFHTLIMNSPFAYTVIKKNLTYIRMGETLSTHNHPLVITMKNVCDIDGSENFFARKFDPEIDYEVIDHYYKRIVCSGN
jgi:hypothetical protein